MQGYKRLLCITSARQTPEHVRLAVVIPTFNRREILKRLLTQIENQSQGLDFEVMAVVAVDGSTDGTIEMLAESFPGVIAVEGPGDWWFTKSLNKAAERALELEAEFIMTTNDDVVLEDKFLIKVGDTLRSMQSRHIVGVVSYSLEDKQLITSPGVSRMNWWRAKAETYFKHMERVNPEKLSGMVSSSILPTRGLLIPVEALRELNLFDEKFPQYYSDSDFCLRASSQGWQPMLTYDVCLYTMDALSAPTASARVSFQDLLHSIRNPYSRDYYKHMIRYYWRHGQRLVFPLTMFMVFFVKFYKVFMNRISR